MKGLIICNVENPCFKIPINLRVMGDRPRTHKRKYYITFLHQFYILFLVELKKKTLCVIGVEENSLSVCVVIYLYLRMKPQNQVKIQKTKPRTRTLLLLIFSCVDFESEREERERESARGGPDAFVGSFYSSSSVAQRQSNECVSCEA